MISTHILDTSKGLPANEVTVILEKRSDSANDNKAEWTIINQGLTNSDGRFLFNCPKEKGAYRIIFKIEAYYKSKNETCFFMDTPVAFQITDLDRKYHIPLLLNPYGYTTYRGS